MKNFRLVAMLIFVRVYGAESAPTSTELADAPKLDESVEVGSKLTEISAVATANSTENGSFPSISQADNITKNATINQPTDNLMTNTSAVDPRTPPAKLRRTLTGDESMKGQSNPELGKAATVFGVAIMSFVLLYCIVEKIKNKEPRVIRGKGERAEDDGIWFEAPSTNWFVTMWRLVKVYISKYFNKE